MFFENAILGYSEWWSPFLVKPTILNMWNFDVIFLLWNGKIDFKPNQNPWQSFPTKTWTHLWILVPTLKIQRFWKANFFKYLMEVVKNENLDVEKWPINFGQLFWTDSSFIIKPENGVIKMSSLKVRALFSWTAQYMQDLEIDSMSNFKQQNLNT